MSKIIECTLFFQEVDLLEIRLEYLYEEIDYFVILESSQTFSGKKKGFIFEENKTKFKKYLDKIIYFKLDEFHNSLDDIINYKKNLNDPIRKKIIKIIKNHTYYNKKHLPWILDTYQREMLHLPLSKLANKNDIIILSDLDEIPSIEFIKYYKNNQILEICSAYQIEFNYFLNYYKNKNWIGTLIFRAENFMEISFNEIRQKSKNIKETDIKHLKTFGGYHFTSVGDLETIKNKIESWAHQEFNSNMVKNELKKNILSGQDLFNRYSGTILKKIDIKDESVFDKKMSNIIKNYDHLLSDDLIKEEKKSKRKTLYKKFLKLILRIIFEIKILLKNK